MIGKRYHDKERAVLRFNATPHQVMQFLGEHLAEDRLLLFLQSVGGRAVREAMKDLRMQAAEMQVSGQSLGAAAYTDAAKHTENNGPYPSKMIDFTQD